MKRRYLALLVPFGSLAIAFCKSGAEGVSCTSVPEAGVFTTDAGACYPDNDGMNGGTYTIDLAVDDTGFTATGSDENDGGTAKNVIATQNEATVTLTLTNTGTMPHGFQVACTSVCPAYPEIPAGCSPISCFPPSSTIPPIMPGGKPVTITFVTPVADNLVYPFFSNAPGDANVPALNEGQWVLM